MAVPLVGVVIVSMIKDAFEDYKRKQNDTKENKTKTQKFDREAKGFKQTDWEKVRVGDIIRVK